MKGALVFTVWASVGSFAKVPFLLDSWQYARQLAVPVYLKCTRVWTRRHLWAEHLLTIRTLPNRSVMYASIRTAVSSPFYRVWPSSSSSSSSTILPFAVAAVSTHHVIHHSAVSHHPPMLDPVATLGYVRATDQDENTESRKWKGPWLPISPDREQHYNPTTVVQSPLLAAPLVFAWEDRIHGHGGNYVPARDGSVGLKILKHQVARNLQRFARRSKKLVSLLSQVPDMGCFVLPAVVTSVNIADSLRVAYLMPHVQGMTLEQWMQSPATSLTQLQTVYNKLALLVVAMNIFCGVEHRDLLRCHARNVLVVQGQASVSSSSCTDSTMGAAAADETLPDNITIRIIDWDLWTQFKLDPFKYDCLRELVLWCSQDDTAVNRIGTCFTSPGEMFSFFAQCFCPDLVGARSFSFSPCPLLALCTAFKWLRPQETTAHWELSTLLTTFRDMISQWRQRMNVAPMATDPTEDTDIAMQRALARFDPVVNRYSPRPCDSPTILASG